MATRNGGSGDKAYSRQIVFEERDDLWWLRGTHLMNFQRLTGLRCDGVAAGMDIGTVYAWADQLAHQRVIFALAKGEHLTSITCTQQPHREAVTSSAIFLDAGFLMDETERAQVIHKLHLTPEHLVGLVANDLGRVYVYQVCDGLYEIDWELTKLPRASVEALIVAAHQQHRKVSCRQVAPKPQRSQRPRVSCPAQSEPVAIGQLALL